jgi:hypothetical protein
MKHFRYGARMRKWAIWSALAVLATSIFGFNSTANAAQGLTYGGPRGGTDINGAYLPQASGFYGIALLWGAKLDGYYGDNGGA